MKRLKMKETPVFQQKKKENKTNWVCFIWNEKSIFVSAFPPDRTWHKVNDLKVDYSGGLGEGKVGHEPRLLPFWTLPLIGSLSEMWV